MTFDIEMLVQFDLAPSIDLILLYFPGEVSCLKRVMTFERHSGFYFVEVYTPCVLIVIISWAGFW